MPRQDLRRWNNHLASHLARVGKSRPGTQPTFLEVSDEAALWIEPLEELSAALQGVPWSDALESYPAVTCAAAAEVGFRFEGVGTVFWARLEEVFGQAIREAQRQGLADRFMEFARRYGLARPVESGFGRQFSIIAWPITNALLPMDIAGPLARVLARVPSEAIGGRNLNLRALRAWAAAWEGVRLTDWLSVEPVAERVVGALLSENASGLLGTATFRRLRSVFSRDPDAFFALRSARRRRARTHPSQTATELGRLNLMRYGDRFALTVSWSPLPAEILESARTEASAKGWRPRLYGVGPRLHADAALGSAPVQLGLEHIPPAGPQAFPDAADVFGIGSRTAAALESRQVDWTGPLLFAVEGDSGVRFEGGPTAIKDGMWLLAGPADPPFPAVGRLADRTVCRLDPGDPAAQAWLNDQGLLAKGETLVCRHPVDALAMPRDTVRPGSLFLVWNPESDTGEVKRLAAGEAWSKPFSRRTLRATATTAPQESAPMLSILERLAAFDAVLEQRLVARIESSIGLGGWPIEVALLCGGRLMAYGREDIPPGSASPAPAGRVLTALRSETARRALLESGAGELRVRLGMSAWESVPLVRPEGEVDWRDERPRYSLEAPVNLVSASSRMPHHFAPTSGLDAEKNRPAAFALRLSDGRLAAPALVLAPDRMDLGALSANFSDVGERRRLIDGGCGILELARARQAWAGAECRTLGALGARARVASQFDALLVRALCGTQWAKEEESLGSRPVSAAAALFDAVLARKMLELPDGVDEQDRARICRRFMDALARTCPDWPSDADLDDAAADEALITAYEAGIKDSQANGRLLPVDATDHDIGSPPDEWAAACRTALDRVARSALVALIAPTEGARVLARKGYARTQQAIVAEFLSDWADQWCLARSKIEPETALSALQFWLAPGLPSRGDTAVVTMARDPFLARAVRYAALQVAAAEPLR